MYYTSSCLVFSLDFQNIISNDLNENTIWNVINWNIFSEIGSNNNVQNSFQLSRMSMEFGRKEARTILDIQSKTRKMY